MRSRVCQFEGQGCIFYHPPVNVSFSRPFIVQVKLFKNNKSIVLLHSHMIEVNLKDPLHHPNRMRRRFFLTLLHSPLTLLPSSKTESTSQQPQSSSGGVFQTTQNINAPVFVPKGSLPNERILSGSLSHTVLGLLLCWQSYVN